MGSDNKVLDKVLRCLLDADARGRNDFTDISKSFPHLSEDDCDLVELIMGLFGAGQIEMRTNPDGFVWFRPVGRNMLH